VIWRERSIAVPGAIAFLLGAIGLAMCDTAAIHWVPSVSGVLSGLVLLASPSSQPTR
jgi:hypothetical protein